MELYDDIEKYKEEYCNIKIDIQINPLQRFMKRAFDLFISFFGLIILLPFFLLIALFIKLDSKGPVFFKQVRVGKYSKRFKIMKFRTMFQNTESMGKLITIGKDIRITKVGNILRKYKIDELPQLFNVFLGQMSFVGPRPEVLKYVRYYNFEEKKILLVQPGITDYASIEYRDESELLSKSDNPEDLYINQIMPDKIRLNLRYLQHVSVMIDIKIILMTIFSIFKRKNDRNG